MEIISMIPVEDGRVEENTTIEKLGSKQQTVLSKRCRKTLILNIRKSRMAMSLHHSVPKHITTLDEKYVRHCLELIRTCALRASTWNILSEDVISLAETKNRSSNNMTRLAIECPLVDGTEVLSNSNDEWIIGTLSSSQSMINILKSPLLQQFHSFDSDQKYISAPLHQRDASVSSTNSSFSDQSSSSSTDATLFQGMLQCTWKNGLPNYVYTVDDKTEVYVAKLLKVESLEGKGLDYVYTFHSRSAIEAESLAKMRVLKKTTFLSNNAEVMETQFSLSVSSDNHTGEVQMLEHGISKNKGLTKKVVNVFKSRHSTKLVGVSPISDAGYQETKYAPNLELAAIVVKHICENKCKDVETGGGWGLKFLKKPGNNSSSTGECSTSVDAILPAGFHGGPRTKTGGPSSLIERWNSGGHCDCGGWDIGCPLTILNTRLTSTDYSSRVNDYRECKSVDLFMQGSTQNVSIMKMANIRQGLHYIHFQSSLSTLQSFAIAVAMIHSHSPVLGSKVCRSCTNITSK